jgi:dienelactone hydrolase
MADIKKIEHSHEGALLEGVFLTRPNLHQQPTVLVYHGWEGLTGEMDEVAEKLLGWGYQVFLADLYGKGVSGETPEECERLMQPFIDDRALLARRTQHVVETVRSILEVNPDTLSAIGFCFGGICVLDLARTGAPLKGVASFHGLLAPSPLETVTPIKPKVILYHGWDDPLAPPADVIAISEELNAAKADWQFLTFGQTMHAFMKKDINFPEKGVQSNQRAADRAWISLQNFLSDCFSE